MSFLDLFEAKHPRGFGLILTLGDATDDLLERNI
jgi:hypothetical protein